MRSAALAATLTATVVVAFHAQSRGSATVAGLRQVAHTQHARPPALVPATVPPVTSRSATHHAARYTPCTHNHRAQLIVVSIKRQHEWACAGRYTLLSTPVTTGATSRPGDATPRGTFAVQGLNRNTTLTTDGARAYRVKYWIPFHLGVWGFHDASWQKMPFGSKHYATRGSHGCVHMPLTAIRWLFHWVHYGTPVRIV
jgi:lipoprotein-anchoring transpeptidase ErfK/SrfK